MNYLHSYFFSLCLLVVFTSCSSSPEVNTGDAAFAKGDYPAAIEGYSQALKNNPTDVDLLFSRGRAYQEVGKDLDAQADFEAALNLDPKNFQVLLSLATVQLDQKSYASALLYATKAEEISGAPALASLLKGRALHQLGMPEDALKAYGNAIQLDGNYGQAYFNRALLKIALDRTKLACEDLRRAVALDYPGAQDSLEKYCR
jgi:tetratricopeptide (TPR) repeat protein